ncbi:hypothetical protein ACKKBG_A10960 [Auxenochlorella protothecoides x Auxenochlorella symbiontica]
MPGAVMEESDHNLYNLLGLGPKAKDTEIRRAFRNLVTRAHPDKGGDAARFRLIQQAYEVLSDPNKRSHYDQTGKIIKTAEEEFMDSFAGGNYRDKVRAAETSEASNISEQITVRQSKEAGSHGAGFEAWMRGRGSGGVQVFTADDVIDQFGVVKGSYDAVPLPRIKAHAVRCSGAGRPREVLGVEAEELPAELEWGQVLVSIRYAAVNPADLYTVATGGTYGQEHVSVPFVPGHDAVGVIVKTGPGVKGLQENDWVVPLKPFLGTWRSLLVAGEKDLLRLAPDAMPMEQCAVLRETLTAYRLLEDAPGLKPGDCVALNAANSAVGQMVLQLASLLRLRTVAVVSDDAGGDFDKTADWLKSLGASVVLPDRGNLKAELDKLKFFAKPKLALDAVGGLSSTRLSDMLAEGGQLVVYGCMSGKSPTWTWHSWVFQGIQVRGFNIRRWVQEHRKRVPVLLESIAKLVNAGKLTAAYTEYELATEFGEALEHALERGKNTKVLLKVSDVGVQY